MVKRPHMPKTAHAQDRTCPRYGDLIIDRHVASNAGHAGHDGPLLDPATRPAAPREDADANLAQHRS